MVFSVLSEITGPTPRDEQNLKSTPCTTTHLFEERPHFAAHARKKRYDMPLTRAQRDAILSLLEACVICPLALFPRKMQMPAFAGNFGWCMFEIPSMHT